MIIVIANREVDEKHGRERLIVSHGYEVETGNTIVLPSVDPREIAIFSTELNEFVLN